MHIIKGEMYLYFLNISNNKFNLEVFPNFLIILKDIYFIVNNDSFSILQTKNSSFVTPRNFMEIVFVAAEI